MKVEGLRGGVRAGGGWGEEGFRLFPYDMKEFRVSRARAGGRVEASGRAPTLFPL